MFYKNKSIPKIILYFPKLLKSIYLIEHVRSDKWDFTFLFNPSASINKLTCIYDVRTLIINNKLTIDDEKRKYLNRSNFCNSIGLVMLKLSSLTHLVLIIDR